MGACQDVDPSNRFKYYNTESEITTELMVRLQHFIIRHQLRDEYLAEDAAGKR